MKKTLILLSVLAFGAALQAQVRVVGDVTVEQMVEKHVELNNKVKTIPGYRVQIGSFSGTSSKANAFALRDKFVRTTPRCRPTSSSTSPTSR